MQSSRARHRANRISLATAYWITVGHNRRGIGTGSDCCQRQEILRLVSRLWTRTGKGRHARNACLLERGRQAQDPVDSAQSRLLEGDAQPARHRTGCVANTNEAALPSQYEPKLTQHQINAAPTEFSDANSRRDGLGAFLGRVWGHRIVSHVDINVYRPVVGSVG